MPGSDTARRHFALFSLIVALPFINFCEAPDADAAEPAHIVVKSIGSIQREFSSLQAWEDARGGNLVTRHLWSVTGGTGRFTSGEKVSGAGCGGSYVPEDEASTNGPTMTVDSPAGTCAAGSMLVGETSGATAIFVDYLAKGGTIERGEVHSDSALTRRLVIAGATVDAAHYLWLTAAPGEEHNGSPGTGARLVVQESWAAAITVSTAYTVIDNLEIVNTSAASNANGIYNTTTTGTRYDRLIVQAVGGTALYFPAAVTSNLLVHSSRVGVYASYMRQRSIYNSTIVNSTSNGVYNQHDLGPKLVNVVVFGSGGVDFRSAGGWAAGSSNNAGSSSSTPPGPQSVTTVTVADFLDYEGENFRLSTTSTLQGAGADVSAVFSNDLAGDPREALWDIGAYAAASGPDLTPPVRSAGAPTGALPASTRSAVLSVKTNEPATCKYGDVGSVAFAAIPSTFTSTGGTSHSTPVSDLVSGTMYTFLVRCADAADNVNPDDYVITFSIEAMPVDTTPPLRSAAAPSGTLPAGTTSAILSVTTDEPATCRYGFSPAVEFAAIPATFATTGGTSHTTPIEGFTDGVAFAAYVRCQDVAGNANSDDFPIGFSVATAGATAVVVKSIGTQRRDFSGVQAWAIARRGNLVTRQVWNVAGGSSRFVAGELVAGEGCAGLYVPEDELSTNGSVMTLDDVSGACADGALLTGQISAATAVFEVVAIRGGAIERGEIYNDAPLTGRAVINGSIVDHAHFMWLTAAPGHEHNGTPGSGARIVVTDSFAAALTISTPYTVIEKLEIVNSALSGTGPGLYNTSVIGTRYDRLIVRAIGGTAIYGPAPFMSNILVHNSQIGIYSSYASHASIYNATIVKTAKEAIRNFNGVGPRLVNVVAFGSGGAAFSSAGGWAAGSHTNGGPPGSSPPGPNSISTISDAAFANYLANDFRPADDSVLGNAGTNLDALFTSDLRNVPRIGFWDMGAYEASSTADVVAPMRSAGAPAGVLAAGTTSVVLSLSTDRPATCKYGPIPGTAFGALPTTFASSGGTQHSRVVTGLVNGAAVSAYIRCQDLDGNTNVDDYLVTFRVATVVVDTTPPVRSAGTPTGSLEAGRVSVVMSLRTNEAATCKYGPQPGATFVSLPGTFLTTGGVGHFTTIDGLTDGASYTAYIRCRDVAGNSNIDDYRITFSIAGTPPDVTPPVRSAGGPSGVLPQGTISAVISLTTDEPATCKYGSEPGTGFSALPGTLSTTSGLTHSVPVAGLVDGTQYVAYVRCQDGSDNVNANDYLITFVVGPSSFDALADNTWMRLNTVPTERYFCVRYVDCTRKAVLSHPEGRHWSGSVHGDAMILYFGGGHQGHPGNDVEIFDVASTTWRQQYQPEGLPTICLTDPTADPACDIMVGGHGAPDPTPLGRPTVQHAFQKIAYDPIRKVFMAGLDSGTWAYSTDARQWTRLTPSLPPSADLTMMMIYDPDLETVLWFPNGAPDSFVYRFDHATNSWIRHDTFPQQLRSSYLFSAFDPHRRKHLVSQSALANSSRSMWLYDALAQEWTQITNVPSGVAGVHSVAYDPVNKVFVMILPHDDGALELWAYDALGQWSALNPGGGRPTGTFGLSSRWNMLHYDRTTEVFLFVNVKAGQSGGTDRAQEGAVETWAYRYRR
jgi:hypothetical protein